MTDTAPAAGSSRPVIAVEVATVWTSPDAVRDIDGPAVSTPVDLAAWTRALDTPARLDLHGRVETQALLGDPVEIVEQSGGWARIVLPGQPSGKDARGYPGWLPAAHLAPGTIDQRQSVTVAVGRASLAEHVGGTPSSWASYGTQLAVAGGDRKGWLPVVRPGDDRPCWIELTAVDLDRPAAADGARLVTEASRFLGLPYLWGGACAAGLDCSGLVYLVARRLGVALPRDADDQAKACDPIPDTAVGPGDLYFFARAGEPVHHVGFALGDGRMLHAPGTGQVIVAEPMPLRRRDTYAGAGRIPR